MAVSKKMFKVTAIDFYLIPEESEQSLADLARSWFEDSNISHAGRDASRIGNTRYVIEIEVVDTDDLTLHHEALLLEARAAGWQGKVLGAGG